MSILTTVFLFVAVVLAILGFTAVAVVRTIKGSRSSGAAGDDEETRLMQQMHQNLRRMEERIEALETILLEPEKSGEK